MSEELLRLFVSSPGDVAEERQRVDLVVERLNAEFDPRMRVETIRWETSHKGADAIGNYQRALAIRAKLLAAKPDDQRRQANAAYDDQALAEQLLANGASTEALRNARDNLTLRRKLADAKSGDADRAEDLAYALRLLGDALAANNNDPDARAAYSEALAIRKKLASAEPKNGVRLNAVAYVDELLAASLLKEGKSSDAAALYKDAVDVERKAVVAEPGNISRQDDLSYADEHMATTLIALGRANETPSYYREALVAREKVAAGAEHDEITAQGKAGAATADKLGGVAWDALFAHEFDEALTVSRRAADLAPEMVWIKTNYAHALMFMNQTDEARAMYLEYRGKQTFKGVLWESSVLDDFSQFRRAGLVRPLMDEIERQFRERPATPAAN